MNARPTGSATPIRGLELEAQSDAPERLIDTESERLIIANILTQPGFFRRVGAQLNHECFGIEQYRRVFALAGQIHEAGGDPLLSECYRSALDAGTAETLGSLTALAFDNVVEITNPERWVHGLLQKAAARRTWRISERLRIGMESGINPGEALATAREELRAVEGSFNASAKSSGKISDAVASIGIDVLLAAPRGTILSPWDRLNSLTNDGPKPGELLLVGARTASARAQFAFSGGSRLRAQAIASCLSPWKCRERTCSSALSAPRVTFRTAFW